MKTERRHELQTNVLADRLARGAEAVRPYGKTILGVVLLLLLAIVVLSFWNSQQKQRVVRGWDEFFSAFSSGNEAALETTAKEYSGTPVAGWARLIEADMTLSEATDQLFSNPAEARGKLRDVVDAYQGLIKDSGNVVVEERATFGLAEAHESLGELQKARGEYETVANKWPDSPHARIAKQRAIALSKKTTKEFYDWLAKYEPTTPAAKLPGVPGIGPSFEKGLENEIPSQPGDISLPSILDKPAAGDLETPAEGTAPANPREGDSKPTDEPTTDNSTEPATSDSRKATPAATDSGDKATEEAGEISGESK
jgi:hypothetical protein